jgi:hypothetical protein
VVFELAPFDGKRIEAVFLKADDDGARFRDRLNEPNPEDASKWTERSKAGSGEASHFFKPITEKEA